MYYPQNADKYEIRRVRRNDTLWCRGIRADDFNYRYEPLDIDLPFLNYTLFCALLKFFLLEIGSRVWA